MAARREYISYRQVLILLYDSYVSSKAKADEVWELAKAGKIARRVGPNFSPEYRRVDVERVAKERGARRASDSV
jgi:hypothetical protein